jgi:branched-chain amino acid transport system permease protein
MSTFILLTVTGLALGALYFLIASGLSLIYGLMGVLNFAHGAFLTVGSYMAWWSSVKLQGTIGSTGLRFAVSVVIGLVAGAAVAALVELVLIRPLYLRHIEQVLVTVGLSFALVALVQAYWGPEIHTLDVPSWLNGTTGVGGAFIPNYNFVEILVAAGVLAGLLAFLRFTRYGLIIRAGVENRAMVTALGIDVKKAFTLVFAIGGLAAALAGVLAGIHFSEIDPTQGTSLLIFAFIVVVIGGLGSIVGSAVAAVMVGLVQQYVNYRSSGIGDLSVVLLLAITLLIRPGGLFGKWSPTH